MVLVFEFHFLPIMIQIVIFELVITNGNIHLPKPWISYFCFQTFNVVKVKQWYKAGLPLYNMSRMTDII